VEAKKEGVSFDMPISKKTIRYKLNGSARTNEELYNAINQAHYYAVEKGIRYAIVTNGYAWVVFRAMREDMSWREGHAIAFSSAGLIKDKFTEFWNLLSWEAISTGNFETRFGNIQPVTRSMYRVIDRLYNPDQVFARNRLHSQLHPLVNRIFGDITEYDQVEIMQRCYVHTTTLRIVDQSLQFVIQDSIPHFAALDGTLDTTPGPEDGGKFGEYLPEYIKQADGSVFLLLGGVGSGKSTFLKRYFQFVGSEYIDSVGHWYYVSFLKPPSQAELESFVYKTILEQIRERYSKENLETRESLLEAFNVELERIHRSILAAEQLDEIKYQRRLSKYIEQWTADENTYVKKLIALLRNKGKAVVICIDNVDQLSPEFQNSIFLLSQRIADELKSLVIVALREETFYTATIQRTFTAYTNQKYHISSPDFKKLIKQRINYARELLSLDDQTVRFVLKSGGVFDKQQVSDFLGIMEQSLLAHNKNIARFIEYISSGNMRVALNLFTRFLYSGSTDVDKMLSIFERSGRYYVCNSW
jgi:ABC-type lipoprotein export system ATPase subunit